MLTIDKSGNNYLYQQVTDLITKQIEFGTLRPGDRLPSLRNLSRNLKLSIPTVKQGYLELERRGFVESRPQSGFYVLGQSRNPMLKSSRHRTIKPAHVRCCTMIECVHEGIHRPGKTPLGIANPSMAKPASRALHRAMKRIMSRAENHSLAYAPTNGEPGLKRQIAHSYLDLGGDVDPDDIIITNGAQEALTIALMAVAGRGDIIAVESPTYFGILELIDSLGMLAIEIETCPINGISLEALETALNKYDIKACLFATAVNNPLGSVTTDRHRKQLVELLENRDIPLIEDDVYGDLVFDGYRPRPAQFFSSKNLVLTCSSFSKTVAPGYRIGWLLSGRYREDTARFKRALSCTSGLLQQMTLSEFIAAGDYDRHIKTLRQVLKRNCERMQALIAQYFPESTRVSQPRGGSVLWLDMPGINSVRLFEQALEMDISTCPGNIFSSSGRYQNFTRLSFGIPWDEGVETALRHLGELVADCN